MRINQAVELAPTDAEIASRVRADFFGTGKPFVKANERGQTEGAVEMSVPALDLARLVVLAFPGVQVIVRAGYEVSEIETSAGIAACNFLPRPCALEMAFPPVWDQSVHK